MNRVIFLVDGFNLYHSVVEAQDHNGGHCVKWLDLRRLCQSYLHMVGEQVKDKVALEGIHYFSAPPTHLSRDVQNRHALYMRCLRSSSIRIDLARFRRKTVKCHLCGGDDLRHEEKETDVAIAARLFELCHFQAADSVALVTGDTDIAPAVRSCRTIFPDVSVLFAFPYRRANEELERLCPGSFKISHKAYLRNQYPDPLPLSDGTLLAKPPEWF